MFYYCSLIRDKLFDYNRHTYIVFYLSRIIRNLHVLDFSDNKIGKDWKKINKQRWVVKNLNKHFIRERGLCIIRCFFGPQKLTQNIQKHVLRDEESPCEEMCALCFLLLQKIINLYKLLKVNGSLNVLCHMLLKISLKLFFYHEFKVLPVF